MRTCLVILVPDNEPYRLSVLCPIRLKADQIMGTEQTNTAERGRHLGSEWIGFTSTRCKPSVVTLSEGVAGGDRAGARHGLAVLRSRRRHKRCVRTPILQRVVKRSFQTAVEGDHGHLRRSRAVFLAIIEQLQQRRAVACVHQRAVEFRIVHASIDIQRVVGARLGARGVSARLVQTVLAGSRHANCH